MSLILDALKKREREKQVPERGFLVTASERWPARRRPWLLAGAGLGALAVTLVGLAVWGRGSTRRAEAPPAVSTPAPRPVPPVEPPARARVPDAPIERVPPVPAVPRDEPAPLPRARPQATAARSIPTPASADRAVPASPSEEYVLHAITRRDGQPIALLNDRLVREGDTFGEVKVVRIGEAEIEIEVRGTRRLLRF
jgi:hypothetical protein